MTDFKLDANGDLDLSSGDIQLVSGDDEILQRLKIKLQFFRGEWFLDQRIGMPYFTDILINDPSLPAIRSFFRDAILGDESIEELNELTLDFDRSARRLNVAFVATKTDGEPIEFADFVIVP